MKHHAHAKPFTWGLIILFVFLINCTSGKKSEGNQYNEVAVQFVQFLKQRMPPGFKFETELGKSTVRPLENGNYSIVLKNSKFTFNTAAVLTYFLRSFDSFLKDDPPNKLDIIMIDEVAVIFKPNTQEMKIKYAKGVRVDRDLTEMVEKSTTSEGIIDWLTTWKLKRARLCLGNVRFNNLNPFEYLKANGKKASDEIKMPEIKVEDIQATFDCDEDLCILVKLEKIKNIDKEPENKEYLQYIEQKNAPLPDISEIMQMGLPLSDSGTEFVNVNISVKKDGKEFGNAAIAAVIISSFLKPDDGRKNLIHSQTYGLRNLNLSYLDKNGHRWTANLDEFEYLLAIDNISPKVILEFLKFAKKTVLLRDSADEKKIREYMMTKGKEIYRVMAQSDPLAFRSEFGIKGLKISKSGNPLVAQLSDIKECRARSIAENIDSKAIQALMEFAEKFAKFKNIYDKKKLREYMMNESKKMWSNQIKPGIVVKSSISPFKHYFGELSVETEYRFSPSLSIKATIKIMKIDEVISKLSNADVLQPSMLMLLRQGFHQMGAVDKYGNAIIFWEMNQDEPGVVRINGMPIRIPPHMFNPKKMGLPDISKWFL